MAKAKAETEYLSEHQKTFCPFCADNADFWLHCSWCGAFFDSHEELYEHLGGDDMTKSECWLHIAARTVPIDRQ